MRVCAPFTPMEPKSAMPGPVEAHDDDTEAVDTLIVGGGIAGLSVLFQLSFHRALLKGGLLLLEREPLCGAAASGRNAGIYRHLEHDGATTALAKRSGELLPEIGNGGGLLSATGAVYLARERSGLGKLIELAKQGGVEAGVVSPGDLPQLDLLLRGGEAKEALFVPGDGVLDVHGMMESVRKGALARGARVRCRACVRDILVHDGIVRGVRLESGEEIFCRRLVIAAGAWSSELAASIGAALPLFPMRRHLVFLQPQRPISEATPVIWRVDDQVYARPESGGYLASPCDEAAWQPTAEPPVEPGVLFDLALRLTRTLPPLADSVVQRVWACLRTFTPDRLPVVGPDPRVSGLYWSAGLGGQGLSVGLAAGELLASSVMGIANPLQGALLPSRLLED